MTHETTVGLLTSAIRARMRDPNVQFAVGASELSAHDEPGRVVWVPAGGRVSAANRQAFAHPTEPLTIHPIATNELRVFAYLEAEDVGSLERLWVDLLTATRDTMGLASLPTTYVLDTMSERASVSASAAARMSQTFEWKLIVARANPRYLSPATSARERVFVLAHELLLELS